MTAAHRLPTFIIIGNGRSGTTSLWHYLRQHPDVFMSDPKEPGFFAFEGASSWTGPGADWVRATSVTTWRDYLALFDAAGTRTALGEASTRYLSAPNVPSRMHARLPDARLVAMLRHPVEATYAHYLGRCRDGWEVAHSFEEALRSEARWRREGWVWGELQVRGFYHEHLSRYLAHFPRHQLGIWLFDDFRADPARVVREVLTFIGVDPSFVPDTSQRLGRTGTPRNPIVRHAWRLIGPRRHLVRPLLPRAFRDWAFNAVTGTLEQTPMQAETRAALLGTFREDTLRLQGLIGRDLSHWLT